MDLKELSELQIKMDDLHGFPVRFDSIEGKYSQLTKDLVGLFGEIGELSNIVKKVNIKIDKRGAYELDVAAAEMHMSEELVDTLIYVMRIGAILGLDLEHAVLQKIKFNEDRYARLRHE